MGVLLLVVCDLGFLLDDCVGRHGRDHSFCLDCVGPASFSRHGWDHALLLAGGGLALALLLAAHDGRRRRCRLLPRRLPLQRTRDAQRGLLGGGEVA
eukprot:scaffold64529_cov74-Phaeocystis_antarctica.AAC.11